MRYIRYIRYIRCIRYIPPKVLAQIDAHTSVDEQLFAAALRLLLGRLRTVETMTGVSILKCIDWHKLRRTTQYVPELWEGGDQALLG